MRRSRRSIPSRRSRSTRRSSACRDAERLAPTAAVAVGLALRRAGIDDQDQSPRGRAQGVKKKLPFQAGQKLTVGCSLILVAAASPGRLALLDPRREVGAARCRHRRRPAGDRAPALDHPAGAAVRAAEGAAAAARRAHRAAAEGADRSRAHARPDQPRAAADAVADRRQAVGRPQRGPDRRPGHVADESVGLRGQPRGIGLSSSGRWRS